MAGASDNPGDHICRRLVLFLDGTWNEDRDDIAATNIIYMRERLFWGLNARVRAAADSSNADPPQPNDDAREYAALPASIRKKGLSGLILDGFEYIVYYDEGVGTSGLVDSIKGGMFGAGLDFNVRKAYRFLSASFRPGDEIYIFGFSRGAFTARSLCGYIGAIGLLKAEHCTAENEAEAWRYYRTPPASRLSGMWSKFRAKDEPLVHESQYARVRVLGVYDTVGALGIPEDVFKKFNRARHGFHDTEISSLVDIRLHAMALDEPRKAFGPAIWTKPKFKFSAPGKSPTEQVWFSGAHSDIGGGYVKWTDPAVKPGLSHLPLVWMLQRLRKLVPAIAPIADAPATPYAVQPRPQCPLPFYDVDLINGKGAPLSGMQAAHKADQHRPWAKLYTVWPQNRRVINQLVADGQNAPGSSGRLPFADPICEFIHVSALQRFNTDVEVDKGGVLNALGSLLRLSKKYRPANLIDVMPYIAATYVRNARAATPWRGVVKPIFTWKELRIVDWNGDPLDPRDDAQAARALSLLPAPADIGFTAMPAAMRHILDPRLHPYC